MPRVRLTTILHCGEGKKLLRWTGTRQEGTAARQEAAAEQWLGRAARGGVAAPWSESAHRGWRCPGGRASCTRVAGREVRIGPGLKLVNSFLQGCSSGVCYRMLSYSRFCCLEPLAMPFVPHLSIAARTRQARTAKLALSLASERAAGADFEQIWSRIKEFVSKSVQKSPHLPFLP